MKKQFFRVKQLADQAFLNAEKSEVLNYDELQSADTKIENLRSALVAVNKKICPNGPIGEIEKRLKKCLEHQLSLTLLEESKDAKEDALFHHVLKVSGQVEKELAREYADHEGKVEELVYSPLQKVIDNELPNITKQKHNLKKYILDKDSASNRYHSTKKEALKEDMEEADSKVGQCRDALATEMFSLLARENELASCILQLLKLQRGYHESALKSLENVIPQLERTIGNSRVKKVFGIPLQEHLRVTGRKLAYPLEICIGALSETGMEEEGLFRLGGSTTKVKRLKASIDSGCFKYLIPEYRETHVLASTLKLYLRELPEPLLTFHLHKEWIQAVTLYKDDQQADVAKHLLNKLPQENRDNLAYLIQFLTRLAENPKNKMTSSNLAIVMAPNLLWDRNEENNLEECVHGNKLVDLFVRESRTLFPEDVASLSQLSISSLYEDEVISRNGSSRPTIEHVDATSMESLSDSPRPNTRKKKPAAPPVPPVPAAATNHHYQEHNQEKINTSTSGSSYPSGSATLNRPPKGKDPPKPKTTVGVNTEENDLSLARRRSLSKDDVQLAGAAEGGAKVVTSAVTGVSKAQPVIRPAPQTVEYKTTAVHQVGSESGPRPVAAPRQSLLADEPKGRSQKGVPDGMCKSLNSDFGEVQLRRAEPLEHRPAKPEIPARPASLAPKSVANKQQPSIVNIQNRNEKIQLGHDVMMAEKEKFLGHSPTQRLSLENKFSDVNSNKEQRSRPTSMENKPSVPPKNLILTKSNEKLEDTATTDVPKELSRSSEKLNELNQNRCVIRKGSLTHSRTRSDGNIMDLHRESIGRTPPSPRSLSKPTEPPPPPPVVTPSRKSEPESTDF